MPQLWRRKQWAARARDAAQKAAHLAHLDGPSLRGLNLEMEEAPPTFRSLTQEFLEETSSHGLGEGA